MPSVGLISDPDFPNQVTEWLAQRLPDQLTEHLGAEQEWTVQTVCDPVTAGRASGAEILQATEQLRDEHGWDYAVCVSDLPLRFDDRPVLADVGVDAGVGLISLPALGGVQPHRRAQQMVVQVLDELIGATEQSRERGHTQRRRGLHSWLTNLLAPIRRETPQRDHVGIRYRGTRRRGRVRLLSGMLRSNTPWRLVLGMSGALAAAVAASAFGLVSSTVWQIGDVLSTGHRIAVIVAVIALMTGWLILGHNLWEHTSQSHDREQRRLYNTSTVLTVGIGVACFFAALFVINLGAGALLITPDLLSSKLGHPSSVTDYLDLAWATSCMGVAAGALGSGLEDDAAVRQAAYGYRESQRRSAHQDESPTRNTPEQT